MSGGVALELLPGASSPSSKNRRMDRMGHRSSHTMAIGQKPDDRVGDVGMLGEVSHATTGGRHREPPRLVFGEQLGRRPPAGLFLERKTLCGSCI
jgi:hypothetical protein